MLLISKYLGISQIFFCYWFLVYFHCVLRAYFVWFLSFKFVKMCFMVQNVVYLDECFLWVQEQYIVFYCMNSSINVDWWYCSFELYSYCSSACRICQLLEEWCWSLWLQWWIYLLLLTFYWFCFMSFESVLLSDAH